MGLAVNSRGSLRLLRNLSLPHFSYMHHRAPDYYAILGVSKHADLDEVKFAYFNMAKKFHLHMLWIVKFKCCPVLVPS